MPHMTLPSGAQILLGVFHENTSVTQKGEPQTRQQTRIRLTIVLRTIETGKMLKNKNGKEYPERKYETGQSVEVKAVCSLNDKFSRGIGRYIACRRLLMTDMLRGILSEEDKANGTPILTKQDRAAIIQHICPELFLTRKEAERAIYNKLRKKFEQEDQKAA